jgi:hypothetical protein
MKLNGWVFTVLIAVISIQIGGASVLNTRPRIIEPERGPDLIG